MEAIILDTETTGTKDARLVEGAWAEVQCLYPVVISHGPTERFNPGVPIECGAKATHHITEEDLIGCRTADAFRLPTVRFLIGHNIDFDWKVVKDSCGLSIEPKRICTLALSRELWPEADSHGLAAMLYLLRHGTARVLCPHAHGARADVEMVAVLLEAILERVIPDSWESLWAASELARIPKIMPYGKHKGVPIAQVPRDYKEWLRRQPDVDPYLLFALGK